MKKLIRTTALVIGFLAASLFQATALQLRLSDGTTTITIVDGGADDANPAAGAITYIGPVGANWLFNATAGLKSAAGGFSPHIDIGTQNVSSENNSTLTIELTETGFLFDGVVEARLGGLTVGNVTFDVWEGILNQNFERSTLITHIGPLPGPAFNGITNAPLSCFGAYSITLVGVINHPVPGLTFFDAELIGPANAPPIVEITKPANNATFIVGENVNIVAHATDSDGTVTNVEFFVGANKLAEVAGPSSNLLYETTWTNPPLGDFQLFAHATDNLGLMGTSAPVTIHVIERPPLVILTDIHLNRQSGLYEQTVRILNPTSFTLNTVGVLVFGVSPPISVFNFTALLGGVPYVQYGGSVPPGGHADLQVNYYVPLNVTNVPPTTLVPVVMLAAITANASGTPVPITRMLKLADGTVLLNFSTVNGANYFIEYSSDMINWKTSPHPVPGNGFTAQWIDYGPPATESFPSAAQRFYRVIQVP